MSGSGIDWELAQAPSWEGMVELPDGYERFVRRFGSGPEKLVCQHGGPGAHQRFYNPLAAIADERLEVILYDQLGGGESERPDDDSLWTEENFVKEFEALVPALDLDRVHLLGQSWGGVLALNCAFACPQLIKTLVLCNTTANQHTAIAGLEGLLAGLPEEVRTEIVEKEVVAGDDSAAGRALLELYAKHTRRAFPFDLERSCREFSAGIVPELGALGRPYYVMWGANEFNPTGTMRGWDVSGRLGEIEVPALIICGAHDEVVPECSREMAEGIPDAQWLILGQSSHCTFQEAEAEVAMAAIRGFVLNRA